MTFNRSLRSLLLIIALPFLYGCKEEPTGNNEAAPAAPRSLKVVDVDIAAGSAADVSWSAPADSGGITGYRIWWREGSAGATDSADVGADARTFTISDLTTGSLYLITAASLRGTLVSPSATIQWRPTFPEPPGDLTLTPVNPTTIRMSWTPPADSMLTGYTVYWLTYGASDSIQVERPATSVEIGSLDLKEFHRFSIVSKRGTKRSRRDSIDYSPNAVIPDQVIDLHAAPISLGSIMVAWKYPGDTAGITYTITWSSANGGNGSVSAVSTTRFTISGLQPGILYTIDVVAVRNGYGSDKVSVTSATAQRYTTEPGSATPLRMYEQQSSNGAGLTIDPALGGPRNILVTTSTPELVQLAMYVDSPTTFVVGAAFGFIEYSNANDFDRNVYISDSSWDVASIDEWMYGGSLQERIPSDGNARAFQSPAAVASTNGFGFYVRTGELGSYHYARVFVKNNNGKLLQGSFPNRYIELEISYQMEPNVPYAKRIAGVTPTGAFVSTVRR